MTQPAGFNTVLAGVFDGAALQALKGLSSGVALVGTAGSSLTTQITTGASGVLDAGNFVRAMAVIPYLSEGASTADAQRTPFIWKDVSAVAVVAGTGFTAWTPGAGKKFRLMGYALSSSAAAALIFGDNAIGTVLHRTPLLAAAGVFTSPPMGNGQLSAVANNVLKVDVSVNSTLTGFLFGTEE